MSQPDGGNPVRVTVWNENVHETRQQPSEIAGWYPDGIHGALAALVAEQVPGAQVRTAVLQDDEHGLSEEVLAGTDVLLWWGHIAHGEVRDDVVERVQRHVLGGMGLLALHSAHYSKLFTRLLGTTGSLAWRNDGEREVVWTIDTAHPIARGVPNPFVIETQEMYGEPFDVPPPGELVFISSFAGGEVFRSGMTWQRGRGRVFYFSPGDQEYPVYLHPHVRTVLGNGVRWAHQPDVERVVPSVSNPQRDWFVP
ncbi:ThuA domain-containing protein [Kineococcus terrestris]|uniref:ThuA domain-containing protein n=1 Tax=Kineococcus terrestris TaxID=2044856 RepID=UPI0034DB4380